jgi:hypothetical protein
MSLDINLVDVRYTPNATRIPEQLPKLGTLADCPLNQNQGWYYDVPGSPTKIELCPGTCARLTAGSLNLFAGCAPLVGTVH